MSLFSFDRLLSIVETICDIILAAIRKLKSPDEETSD